MLSHICNLWIEKYACFCIFGLVVSLVTLLAAFSLKNSSPCFSDIQLVYLLPRLSKYLSCFCESKIPVYNLSLPAQRPVRQPCSLGYALCTGKTGKNVMDRTRKKVNNYLRLWQQGLQALFTALVAFAAGITRFYILFEQTINIIESFAFSPG